MNDIEVLEGIIKGDEDCIESISKFNSNNKEYDEDIEHYKREIRGITNIIKAYKELEEENRIFALEGSRVRLKIHIDKNYIPVSLVEEKIEELKDEYKIALEENSTKAFILKCQIQGLEELLNKNVK